MTDTKKILDFLDALTDATGESENQTPEEIKQELRDDGVEVDGMIDRLLNSVENISMKAKRQQLETAKHSRLQFEKNKPSLLNQFKDWTKEQVMERIRELADSPEKEVAFAYRELENKSDDDLRAILEDLEFTRLRQEQNDDD